MISKKEYNGSKTAQIITTTLAAGSSLQVPGTGEAFYLIESTSNLFIKSEGSTLKEYTAQTGEVADVDTLFQNLEIQNRTGVDITFTLWFGFGQFIDKRKEVSIVGLANVVVTASALPTGASTAAKQATPRTEDAASAGGEDGIPSILVRRDDVTEQTSAAGDFTLPVADRFGATVTKDQQKLKRTYSASMVIAPAATPTDVFEMLGAANRIVEITKIRLSGIQTTAGLALFNLIKRSAANTSGTSSVPTAVPHEAGDAAAAAGLKNYSANPGGLGAAVGTVRNFLAAIGAATSLQAPVEIVFGENGKPVTLLSATQSLCLNMGGVTLTGGTLYLDIEWTETTI